MVPPDEGETLVLIVEDELDNREIMRAVVEEMLGYRALLAADGKEALRLANDRKPNVILIDLMMPVLDGFETIQHLKAQEDTASIPVIAISALSRPVDRQHAVESGVDDYLGKPFDLDDLAEMVQRHASAGGKVSTTQPGTQPDFEWDSESAGY